MFSRRKRLSRQGFASALLKGVRLASSHLTLFVPAQGEGYAVIVSKKTARSSVDRHRLKRRVLEALRPLPLPPSLIVYPRASALKITAAELRAELHDLLSKIRPFPIQ